jgi:hypothetical protein
MLENDLDALIVNAGSKRFTGEKNERNGSQIYS